ncbi:adenosine kinase [Faucicola atlantae]|uniref:Adenosine kinase n=1 Tax=Faucicola atlantae TaxID=34059 RepID=A0A1B8QCP2_9GAMM|nr:adenosine kinase [Moraxella atlantae]OBX78831.1 adenosine kinase [Moraxella atlantae]
MANIVAIGNALVDREYRLTDTELQNTGLVKGNMTLASRADQQTLLDRLANMQLHPVKQASGGSAANSAYAAACLGSDTFYACRVGDDDAGQFYLADLNTAGVATSNQSIAFGGTTGSCVVLVTPDGERTMQTHLGTSAEIGRDDIDFSQLSNAQWLYFEGYLAMSATMQPALATLKDHARAHNIKIVVSFADPSVIKFAREGLDAMLAGGVAAVFCNAEEAQLYTGKHNQRDAAEALLAVAELAVVTAGAQDTIIARRVSTSGHGSDDKKIASELINVPTALVNELINTNGAGDSFAGAFLHGLARGYDLITCGKIASAVAGEVVQTFGARLPPEAYRHAMQHVLAD